MDFDFENEKSEFRNLVRIQNRKKKSGGFQSMGLSSNIFKGILRKGYKIPTPIQRRTIPVIMDGRDVVAMARTGSGKTAAFLIPLLERLMDHKPTGTRGLILSPTRELALQTFKFAKEIGRFTRIKFTLILGGDKIENQFAAIHESPDVIIGTPGRLIHVLLEMNLKLNFIEYVVLDEADRLFEMGFHDQLQQILSRVSETRQTLLFSATLPKMVTEFASAGLNNPELVRLDVDTKLSENLKMVFLECRSDDKMAVLLHLLNNVVHPKEMTVIFVATKHHVELLNIILMKDGHKCTFLYSSLDPLARKINTDKFRRGVSNILIVTDLAARGIDVPLLDNAINFNFPAKSKLFLHRVGRVARAGRSGISYSIVSLDEKAFVLDLFMFLGRPLTFSSDNDAEKNNAVYGKVPQLVIDEMDDKLRQLIDSTDVTNMLKVSTNAYKKYLQSRPQPSSESIKRVKNMRCDPLSFHHIFDTNVSNSETERDNLLKALKTYKPNNMKKEKLKVPQLVLSLQKLQGNKAEVKETKSRHVVDKEHFINYQSSDYQTEKGLSIESGFEREAALISLDVDGDDEDTNNMRKTRQVWDRKRKRFQNESNLKNKKIKLESGVKVNGSFKKNLYKSWLHNKNKGADDRGSDGEENKNYNGPSDRGYNKNGGNKNLGGNKYLGRNKFGGNKNSSNKFGNGERFGRNGKFGVNKKSGNKFDDNFSKKGRFSKEGGSGSGTRKKRELKRPDEIVKKRTKRASLKSFQQKQIGAKRKNKETNRIRNKRKH